VTGALRESCECAQDKLTERDVKLIIIGRAGGSAMSGMERNVVSRFMLYKKEKFP
jgi:hypothetical protein